MNLEEKYPYEKALEDINALLDKKNVLPRRREALENAIESVAEGMKYGYVAIKEDGTITQTLIEPVGNLTELVYKPHVTAAIMNKELGNLRVYNQPNVNLSYITMYTGKTGSEINRLEPTDRNIADSISFFFQ